MFCFVFCFSVFSFLFFGVGWLGTVKRGCFGWCRAGVASCNAQQRVKVNNNNNNSNNNKRE
jgi:hypothetical protein